MPINRFSYRIWFLWAALVLTMFAGGSQAREGRLGEVHFPTSTGSEEAQEHFLRGVAALHSFWYPVALDEFRAATRIDPDFMMGYWGEAMACNHPLWRDPQTIEVARKALAKIRLTPRLTPRERAYLRAVTLLYGEGDKPDRDKAYAGAMEEIHREYPDDLEAAAFYALALLGTVRPDDRAALRTRMRAGAVALEVHGKAPNHPGAAHYILHAFDDPDHAILALPAARRYAEIAPAAPHALHMPSHIFLHLGMWPEAAAANEASWSVSDRWAKSRHLPLSQRDYHSLHWLQYVYLQQGHYRQAEALLATMQESLAEFPKDDPRTLAYGLYLHASMGAAFMAETERWELAEKFLHGPQEEAFGDSAGRALAVLARAPAVFAQGLAAAMKGSASAQESIAALRSIREQTKDAQQPFVEQVPKILEIQAQEIAAVAAAARGDFDEALGILLKAAPQEETLPTDQGPPPIIKPPHELYGEILLKAGRPQEAARQFADSLFLHPNRARSLLGAARAAARSADTRGAQRAYAQFLQQWQPGDGDLPELREAEEYLKQTGGA